MLTILFINRKIKINGKRLEIGEIESIIKQNINVENIIILKNDCLFAYIETSLHQNEYITLENELKLLCSTHLQSFMIPSVWIFMKKFPLNNNGKVDRLKLKQHEIEYSHSIINYWIPNNEIETNIYDLLNDIGVNIKTITKDISSWNLSSLDAIRFVNNLSDFDIDIDIISFITYTNIDDIIKNNYLIN